MEFKPYEEYKKVDLPWIEEIPSHWEISRIKDSINYNTNGYWGEEPEGNKHDYICIRVADFDMKNYSVTKNKKLTKRNIRLDNNDRRFLEKGDLLIEKSGGGEKQPVGRVIQYNMKEKAVCSNFISKINISKKNINSKYILFLLNNIWDTRHIMPYIKQTTGIQNLDDKSFFSNYIQIPPKEEQDKIADFLDNNLVKIDKFVELTERQIALLKEQKEVIINDAVTKGIDKNVEYKDSGIDWIGEIPAHWEVIKLKYISDIKTGNKDTINKVDEGKYPFFVRSPKIERIDTYSFDGEAILTAGDGVGAGKVFHYFKGKFDYHQRVYNIYNINSKISGKFLYFYLKENFKKVILAYNAKSTVDSIRLPMLSNFFVVYSFVSEQEEIVAYIEKETSKIDRTVELYKSQIDLIKEYRTSLIASAVTGKIDVRDL